MDGYCVDEVGVQGFVNTKFQVYIVVMQMMNVAAVEMHRDV